MKIKRFIGVIAIAGVVWLNVGLKAAWPQASRTRKTSSPKTETSVAANDKYVYVVRGSKLYKFDAATLGLLRQTSFPKSKTVQPMRASSRKTRTTRPRFVRPKFAPSKTRYPTSNRRVRRSPGAPLPP